MRKMIPISSLCTKYEATDYSGRLLAWLCQKVIYEYTIDLNSLQESE